MRWFLGTCSQSHFSITSFSTASLSSFPGKEKPGQDTEETSPVDADTSQDTRNSTTAEHRTRKAVSKWSSFLSPVHSNFLIFTPIYRLQFYNSLLPLECLNGL